MHSMFRRLMPATAALVLALSCFSVSRASTAPPIGRDRPTPTNVSTVGTMRVEQYGSGSPAMVFIPGLACGSWVWDDTVKLFAKTHAVYVVTLAGFDGLPSPSGSPTDSADASLLKLISGLDRPIVVGHSLGGFLALRLGIEHSQLVRGIIAVDGTPVYPMLSQSTDDQRAAAAKQAAGQIAGESPREFEEGEQSLIPTMVTDPDKAAQIATLAGKASPRATSEYAREIFATDLRPRLKDLTAPTLEIAPVPTKPATFEPPDLAKASIAERSTAYQQFYTSLFPGAPNVKVVPIADSLHFVMVDQPQALDDAISTFIATLPA